MRPTLVKPDSLHGDEFEHPAFGNISVSNPRGGIGRLFGSELNHRSCVRIEISAAKLRRCNHNETFYGGPTIVAVDLSEAQWARVVSSIGDGSGTPCTIALGPQPGYPLERKPDIVIDPIGEKFASDIERNAIEYTAELRDIADRLEAKGANKALVRELKIRLDNLPKNLAYTHNQFVEGMEQVVSDAKIEIDAHINGKAKALGIEAMRDQFPALPISIEMRKD